MKFYLFLCKFVILLGIMILLCTTILFSNTLLFLKTAQKTLGIVIDSQIVYLQGKKVEFPIIEFMTDKGEKIVFKVPIAYSKFKYKKGEKLDIYYNPNNPYEIKIKAIIWVLVRKLTIKSEIVCKNP